MNYWKRIMKKTYLQPSAEMDYMETESMICSSPGVASDTGIGYGGVDEEGVKDPASRRYDVWGEEEALEEECF